jgi:3-phytase
MTKVLRNALWIGAAFAAAITPLHARDAIKDVPALRETPPVGAALGEDAADDPAIYRTSSGQVRILGTNNKGGLIVYDLAGRIVEERPGGRPNNVDTYTVAGVRMFAVTSDRTDNAIAVWELNPATGALSAAPVKRVPSGFGEIYGICAGTDRVSGTSLVVATSTAGDVGVWDGTTFEKLGGFNLGSITEGCVVDGHSGVVYVAQEDFGIWRFAWRAPNGQGRRLIDEVKPKGSLAADVEGLAIWRLGARGFLVASVQGESRFAVYDLDADNRLRGTFRITGAAGADEVTVTDGIDVLAGDLGPGLEKGLLVVQDDVNTDPVAAQNFKYVSWGHVARALRLR